MRFLLLLFLAGCAGRPSFSNPQCEKGYDDCVSNCESDCPASPAPNEEPLYDDPQVDCATCVNNCRSAASKCESR